MKRIIKLFVSQPMNGLTPEQITENRERAIDYAKNELHEMLDEEFEVEVIDSYIKEAAPESRMSDHINGVNVPMWYLSKAIELLAGADAIIIAKGGSGARGCKIEREIADQYDIEFLIEERDEDK